MSRLPRHNWLSSVLYAVVGIGAICTIAVAVHAQRAATSVTLADSPSAELATSDNGPQRPDSRRGQPIPTGGDSCAGHCGGQAPSGCWCDEACYGAGDCCADVCLHCLVTACSCADNCGSQAPGGCWCDETCHGAGDCCLDVCTECDHPQCSSCAGNCGTSAPNGCYCDDLCVAFGDCCDDACSACDVAGCDSSCNSKCGSSTPSGCWCDSSCHAFGDCCLDKCTWCEASACSCPGDINNDGTANVSDLLILLGAWGTCGGTFLCGADLNGDTFVDVSDLLVLLSAWGPCSACDDPFVCGNTFPDGYCEEGCICTTTFQGQNVCLTGAAPCGPACPDGTCPPGQVCIVDTCCGASNCVDVAWLDCGTPLTGATHDGPTVGGEEAWTAPPARR